MTVGIDSGQTLTYNANFPISGINQSSQPFRANFAILKAAIENIQLKTINAVGALTGTSAVFDSGSGPIVFQVDFSNGVIAVPSGLPSAPSSGSLRFNLNTNNLEFFAAAQWNPIISGVNLQLNSVLIGNNINTINFSGSNVTTSLSNGIATVTIAGQTLAQTQAIIGGMFTGNTQTGLTTTYNSSTEKINVAANSFTITLAGSVNGSATVTNLSNITIPTSGGASVEAIAANQVLVGQRPLLNIFSTNQLVVVAKDNPLASRVDLSFFTLDDGWWRTGPVNGGSTADNFGQIINMGGIGDIPSVIAVLGTVLPSIISPADSGQGALYLMNYLPNATS